MAINDQYSDPPFAPGADYASTGAPGSAPTGLPETSTPLSDRIEAGTVGNSAVITPLSSSLANADVVSVGPKDVLLPAQADLYSGSDADPLSGLPGDAAGLSGAGSGHSVMTAGGVHVNSTARRPS